jgi:hypothetical protein
MRNTQYEQNEQKAELRCSIKLQRRAAFWERMGAVLLGKVRDPAFRAYLREQFEERLAIGIRAGLPEDAAAQIAHGVVIDALVRRGREWRPFHSPMTHAGGVRAVRNLGMDAAEIRPDLLRCGHE